MQRELDIQVQVTQSFDQNRREVRTKYAKKAEDYRTKAKQAAEQGDETLAKVLEDKAQKIEQNLRLFDGITSALYAPNSNGIVGDVARAVSPQVAYRIGQYFKENEIKNQSDGGNRPEEQSPQHLLAHAILGAATSYATGNDITAGALAGATSEKTAPILASYLYGKDTKELTQEQKDTITSVITLGTAGIAYGATGDVSGAVSASEVGKVGVEWNSLLGDDTRKLTKEFFENAANSAKEMYPESPAVSGFFKGLSDAVDGGLSLTDASLETLATAIHCASGGDYCQDGFKNNEERAQVLKEAIAYIGDGKASEQLADWAWRLTQGNIEEQHEATEQLARVSTSLGLSGIGVKNRGIENSENILHGVKGGFHVELLPHVELPPIEINVSRLPKTPNLWEKIKDWFKKSDKKDENSESVYDGQGQQLDKEEAQIAKLATETAMGVGAVKGVVNAKNAKQAVQTQKQIDMARVENNVGRDEDLFNVPTGGAKRANTYSQYWQKANLNSAIKNFAGDNPKIIHTQKGKTIYENTNTGIQVVYDREGDYFRIFNPRLNGKRKYLDLDGNIPNNKTLPNGKQVGRSQDEYNSETHFKVDRDSKYE